jgi:hypothetical protein
VSASNLAPIAFKLTTHSVLVDFYPETNYGGGKYYVADGQYSTCYNVPAQLENAKSFKLGPDVKECHLYEEPACNKVKGKYRVYAKDEPDVTLSPILSLECFKK